MSDDNYHKDRIANRPEMNAIINEAFSRHSREALVALLNEHRIACSNLNSVADLERHPQLRNQKVDVDGTALLLADLPVRIDGDRPHHVPALDEHGPAIRREFVPAGPPKE